MFHHHLTCDIESMLRIKIENIFGDLYLTTNLYI